VLEVENWEAAPVGGPCAVEDASTLPPQCHIDRHFALLYDLVVNAPPNLAERWLPYVVGNNPEELRCRPPREDNKPGIRCPPAIGGHGH
jgi:hypothetical protein